MTKYNIDFIKNFCKKIGGECLSKEYKNIKDPLLLKCPSCHKIFKRNLDNLLTRKNPLCSSCSKRLAQSKRFCYDYVKKYIEQKGCNLISTSYLNCDTPLKIKYSCGSIYYRTFFKFKEGSIRCKNCSLESAREKLGVEPEEIIRRLKSSGYILLKREFYNHEQWITVKCDKGHTYKTRLSKFTSGRRCPNCHRSTGEKRIIDYLSKQNIKYKEEYTFEDLHGVGGGRLRFDFAVFEGEKLKCLIEYDGKQHFESTPVFNDNSKVQYHDKIKNEYCKANNIKLIRINYKDFSHIEEILCQQNIV